MIVKLAVTVLMLLMVPEISRASHPPDGNVVIGDSSRLNGYYILHAGSITKNTAITRRAVYSIRIASLTEEYTADYDCSAKTIHIFKVTVKESDKVVDHKYLYINKKAADAPLDMQLLDTVCRFNR